MDLPPEPPWTALDGGRLSVRDSQILALSVIRLVCIHGHSLLGSLHVCAQVAYEEGMSATTDAARLALMRDVLETIRTENGPLLGNLIRAERQAGRKWNRFDLSHRLEQALMEASEDLEPS